MTDPFADGFTPESMVLWALDMAKEAAIAMENEERLELIRALVAALEKGGIIDPIDPANPEGAFTAAAQMLYTCSLATMIFAPAYNHAENHLNNIEQLNKNFEL